MKVRKTWVAVATVVVALLLTAGSCDPGDSGSKHSDPYADAPTTKKAIVLTWTKIRTSDGYNSMETACMQNLDGTRPGLRLFSMFHGDGGQYGDIEIVPDATCK